MDKGTKAKYVKDEEGGHDDEERKAFSDHPNGMSLISLSSIEC